MGGPQRNWTTHPVTDKELQNAFTPRATGGASLAYGTGMRPRRILQTNRCKRIRYIFHSRIAKVRKRVRLRVRAWCLAQAQKHNNLCSAALTLTTLT